MHSIAQAFVEASSDRSEAQIWLSAATEGTIVSFDPWRVADAFGIWLEGQVQEQRLSIATANLVADRYGVELRPDYLVSSRTRTWTVFHVLAYITHRTEAAVRRYDVKTRQRLWEWRRQGDGFWLKQVKEDINLFDLRCYELEQRVQGNTPPLSTDIAVQQFIDWLHANTARQKNAALVATAEDDVSIDEFKIHPTTFADRRFDAGIVRRRWKPHPSNLRANTSLEARVQRWFQEEIRNLDGDDSLWPGQPAMRERAWTKFGLSKAGINRALKKACEAEDKPQFCAPGRRKSTRSKSTRT